MCHARNMLLIVDEEQTGLGKLGQMFGFEQEGIVPDIITVAKHFGGGVGISAVITTEEIEDKVIRERLCGDALARERSAHLRGRRGEPRRYPRRGRARKARKIGAHMRERLEALRPALRDHRRHPRPRPAHGHRAGARPLHQGAGDRRRQGDGQALLRERPDLLRRSGSVLRFVPPSTTAGPDRPRHG